jgi:hypothetical protein
VAVDDRTLETEFANRPLQLPGRGLRVGRGDRCEAGESGRVASDRLGDEIVRFSRQRRSLSRGFLLDARRCQRDDLDVDPRGIHVGDPAVSEVEQLVGELGIPQRLARLPGKLAGALQERRGRSDLARSGPALDCLSFAPIVRSANW